jgi:hypothetical protein
MTDRGEYAEDSKHVDFSLTAECRRVIDHIASGASSPA